MSMVGYFALAVATAFAAVYIKQIRPDFALLVTLAGVAVILSGVVPQISLIVGNIQAFAQRGNFPNDYFVPMFKIIGISYVAQFAADICRDAGEGALSTHIETLGKVIMTFVALPIVEDVFSLIIELLE